MMSVDFFDSLRAPVRLLLTHRRLLSRVVFGDLRARYAGSVVGMAWIVAYPVAFLGVYSLVYMTIFQVRVPGLSSSEYILMLFAGLVPFMAFSEALNAGVTSLTANTGLIRNTLFPAELLPVKAVLSAQPTLLVGLLMILGGTACLGRITFWVLLVPLLWGLQLSFALGIAWVLSCVNIYLRDLQSITGVILLMLMTLSPIAYSPEMAPARLKPFLVLNPLYGMILCYQDCLVFGRMPDPIRLAVWSTLALLTGALGFQFFLKVKRSFFDAL